MRLRSGITINSAEKSELDFELNQLVEKAPAKFILLTDVSGQVITSCGVQNQLDLIPLGSILAGGLSASQEVALMLGDDQEYQVILHEGANANTFMSNAGPDFAFLVQLDTSVPLGWARVLILETAKKIGQMHLNHMEHESDSETDKENKDLSDFKNTDNLSDQIGDSLDSLWNG
jgi:predicted regulator of Ras-like GTPase activity (Roadblock/LC7/MglB family)